MIAPAQAQGCAPATTRLLLPARINQRLMRQGRSEVQNNESAPDRCDLEAQQFIQDAAKLIVESAAQGAAVHVSQSFSGSAQTSAILVCLIACPEPLALEVQDAVDQAVEKALGNFRVSSIN